MAEEAVVREVPITDLGRAEKETKSREQSTVEFPYSDLDSAVEVAKAVHQVGGTNCQWDQLAAKMGQAATGGGFRTKVASAKTFGLLTWNSGIVSLTKLGSQVCDPDQEAQAKAEAFLNVELYSKIHEQFKGSTLPPSSGLESTMVSMGVAQKQKDRARQVFTKSATQAGFFAYGPTRLVAPAFKGVKKIQESKASGDPIDPKKGSGGNEPPKPPPELDPVIVGLLAKLPPSGAQWSKDGRRKWLQTVMNVFDLTYTTADDDAGDLSISLNTKFSAN